MQTTTSAALAEKIKAHSRQIHQVQAEVHKVVVGQDRMISRLLIGLFTQGHVLLEGVPGLAKTLTITTLARALQLSFQRIQFTPDLLPADLVGTLIYNQQQAAFQVRKGPIFANLILADEINRSPAKVQSALLEAMQERQVTIGDTTYALEAPFLVLATQNPVDQEGTYPLPEAQVDRFMMRIFVEYPTRAEEVEIMRRMAQAQGPAEVHAQMTPAEILGIRNLLDEVQVSERLENYIVDLVIATRNPKDFGLQEFATYLEFGASPRATIALNKAARMHAILQGRTYALPEDVKETALDVLNHRLIMTYEAEAERITSRDFIHKLLSTLPI